MTRQLVSPANLTPTIPDHLTPDQRVALWMELFDASEAFLLAGLRRECGPEGDLAGAYRRWYQQQMKEHDRVMRRMGENFLARGRNGTPHASPGAASKGTPHPPREEPPHAEGEEYPWGKRSPAPRLSGLEFGMAANLVLQSLKHVWVTLDPLGFPLALMGGLALALWKHVRVTRDVDLLVGIESNQLDAILQELKCAGCRPKHHPPLVGIGN